MQRSCNGKENKERLRMAKKLTKKRKAEIMFSDAYATITSREVASMTKKRHADVLRDIEVLVGQTEFQETQQNASLRSGPSYQQNLFYKHYYQVDGKGKKYPMYVIGETFGMLLLSGYSPTYRLSLIKELQQRRENAQSWHTARENLRHEHWQLTGHIKRLSVPNEDGEVLRDGDGKRLVMRYSTELDMLNRLVLGLSAKQFKEKHEVMEVRDALSQQEVDILDRIHKHNISLLSMDLGYYARKAFLKQHVSVLIARHRDMQIENLRKDLKLDD